MTRRRRAKRSQAGIVLFELMLSTFMIAVILGVIVSAMVMVSRMFALESNNASFASSGRNALDMMRQDAIGSSQVLATYTTNGTTYTSNATGTIILQTPAITYNSDGTMGTTYQDIIIYHLVGTSAPYTLDRMIVPAAGSPTPAQADTVIARNVSSLAISFIHHASWTGDGVTTNFPLDCPKSSLNISISATVTNGGVAMAVATNALQWLVATLSAPNGVLSLLFPPANGAVVDASYTVDPGTVGPSSISTVDFDLTMSAPVTVSGAPSSQSLELMSVAKLRNH